MSKSPEQYQPTREEIKKAEDMMTEQEKQASVQRFEQKEKEIIEKLKSGQIKSWGKEAGDFEKEKVEEMKRHAPLYFIYRDNALFKKHVPIILKNLTEMGRPADIQIFPEGTRKEDIKKWYEENKKLLSKKAIVSDETADIPYEMDDEVKYELGARNVEGVDRLINKVLKKILFGEVEPNGNIETSKRFITTIIKNILNNPDQRPEKVLLLSSNMGDHLYDLDREKLKEGEKDNKDYAWTKEAREYVTAKVKGWLVEGGLKSEQIEIISDDIAGKLNIVPGNYFDSEQKKFLEKLDQPNTWIITDRHTGIDNNESKTNVPIRSAIVLKMPLGNFYHEAKNHNLIYSSEEEIENEWKNVLKNEFGN